MGENVGTELTAVSKSRASYSESKMSSVLVTSECCFPYCRSKMSEGSAVVPVPSLTPDVRCPLAK